MLAAALHAMQYYDSHARQYHTAGSFMMDAGCRMQDAGLHRMCLLVLAQSYLLYQGFGYLIAGMQ